MKRLTLKRIVLNSTGTYGVLIHNNTPFAVTAERESLCNIPNESCIPAGKYICKRVNSPSHGDCFEITNVPGRSHILFHKGNIAEKDSAGCVLIAESFNLLHDMQAVTDSTHGYNEFMQTIGTDKAFHLTILEV